MLINLHSLCYFPLKSCESSKNISFKFFCKGIHEWYTFKKYVKNFSNFLRSNKIFKLRNFIYFLCKCILKIYIASLNNIFHRCTRISHYLHLLKVNKLMNWHCNVQNHILHFFLSPTIMKELWAFFFLFIATTVSCLKKKCSVKKFTGVSMCNILFAFSC